MNEKPFQVAILHAFSRKNAGDGLLIDLTYDALEEAGVERDRIAILALDPNSVSDVANVFSAPGEPTARPTWRLANAALELVADFAGSGTVRRVAAQSHALVAVGGGYLVTDSPVRQTGVLLNHLAQLRVAAAHAGPTVYLPQSIGPLSGVVGGLARKKLSQVGRVWARDETTLTELALPNVRRCPDLAVMKLAQTYKGTRQQQQTTGSPLLVARDLPAAGEYVARLQNLNRLVPHARWAVQADVPGPRSDRSFYRRLGWADAGALSNLLGEPGGPVVSVRLHGAIAALIAGRPAIHLAYERKGWGAYEDLGLSEWVHDARRFDPGVVASQLNALITDSCRFWACIERAQNRIVNSRADMIEDLRLRIFSDTPGQ